MTDILSDKEANYIPAMDTLMQELLMSQNERLIALQKRVEELEASVTYLYDLHTK